MRKLFSRNIFVSRVKFMCNNTSRILFRRKIGELFDMSRRNIFISRIWIMYTMFPRNIPNINRSKFM